MMCITVVAPELRYAVGMDVAATRTRRKVWLYAGLGVALTMMLAVLLWQLPEAWVLKSSLANAKTIPFATVLGTSVGDKDQAGLRRELAHLQTVLSNKNFAVSYADATWKFSIGELGIGLDTSATATRVWRLNKQPFGDKVQLLFARKNGHLAVQPVLLLDEQQCQSVLKPVVAINRPATDAALYFDNEIKIKPDVPGVVFDSSATCRAIATSVMQNRGTTAAQVSSLGARYTYADYHAQLPVIAGRAGRTITFHYGAYIKKLDPKQLLSYLLLSKVAGKPTAVIWDRAKLAGVAAEMAGHIDTFTAPHLQACQELVSYGGVRLDQPWVIATLEAQSAATPADYTLKTYTVQPVIRPRSYLNGGTKGTVYLTYDDGMTYAGTIMNTAACYGIHVTFFEVGSRADSEASLLKRAIAEGHAVQSHGYLHAIYDYGTGHSYSWQVEDIKHSIAVLQAITGRRPTYFRPPGGNHTADTSKAAAANGIKLVLWDLSSLDTTNITSSQICTNVVNGAGPGYVVLMHATHIETANALPCIAEGLAARGYAMQALW